MPPTFIYHGTATRRDAAGRYASFAPTALNHRIELRLWKQFHEQLERHHMSIGALLFILAIAIIVFLICREIVCWYWKINERNDLLRDIYNLLEERLPDKSKDLTVVVHDTKTEQAP